MKKEPQPPWWVDGTKANLWIEFEDELGPIKGEKQSQKNMEKQ